MWLHPVVPLRAAFAIYRTINPSLLGDRDPITTGSIVRSEKKCEVCGAVRGFVYDGPSYGLRELESVCPWCIADGSAHLKFGVEFVGKTGVGSCREWESVPEIYLTKWLSERPDLQVGSKNAGSPIAEMRVNFSGR